MTCYFKSLLLAGAFINSFCSFVQGQEQDPWIDSARVYQEELNEEFRSRKDSPLKPEDRKKFKELDFFPIDMAYRVEARLVLTPEEQYFMMPTTTKRLGMYRKYGELHFELKGGQYVLNVYKNRIYANSQEYQDYLFLPFRDQTNGQESYAGGRYIGLFHKKEDGDSVYLDFNRAYNPYCAYNESYSCPIVPSANALETRIEAGVKKFHK